MRFFVCFFQRKNVGRAHWREGVTLTWLKNISFAANEFIFLRAFELSFNSVLLPLIIRSARKVLTLLHCVSERNQPTEGKLEQLLSKKKSQQVFLALIKSVHAFLLVDK